MCKFPVTTCKAVRVIRGPHLGEDLAMKKHSCNTDTVVMVIIAVVESFLVPNGKDTTLPMPGAQVKSLGPKLNQETRSHKQQGRSKSLCIARPIK